MEVATAMLLEKPQTLSFNKNFLVQIDMLLIKDETNSRFHSSDIFREIGLCHFCCHTCRTIQKQPWLMTFAKFHKDTSYSLYIGYI